MRYNSLGNLNGAELAEALASAPESVTSVKLGWKNREEASLAIDRLSKHVKNNNGKNDAEEILRVLALDELEALRSIYFAGLNSAMTTSRGLHNSLSSMVSTSTKVASGEIGNFPKEIMPDILPSIFAPFLCGDENLGRILKKCYDNKIRIVNEQDQPIASPLSRSESDENLSSNDIEVLACYRCIIS